MWDLPGPGIEPASPALAGRSFTTGPPGKSSMFLLKGTMQWQIQSFLAPLVVSYSCAPCQAKGRGWLTTEWIKSLGALEVKNLPANAEDIRDAGSIPGSEDPLEEGLATHSGILENPMDRGAWRATVHGVAKGWTQLKWLSSSSPLAKQGLQIQVILWYEELQNAQDTSSAILILICTIRDILLHSKIRNHISKLIHNQTTHHPSASSSHYPPALLFPFQSVNLFSSLLLSSSSCFFPHTCPAHSVNCFPRDAWSLHPFWWSSICVSASFLPLPAPSLPSSYTPSLPLPLSFSPFSDTPGGHASFLLSFPLVVTLDPPSLPAPCSSAAQVSSSFILSPHSMWSASPLVALPYRWSKALLCYSLSVTNWHLPSTHMPVVMFGCESWTIKKIDHRRTDAFVLWSWRWLLRVPWTARRSHQSILKEVNQEYSLEGQMLKLKFQYFGHLMARANSSAKTLMQQKMRRLHTVTDSMSLSKLREIVEDRRAWYAAVLGAT